MVSRVERGADTMKSSVEMTQTASQVGAKPTLRSSRALRGITSREVPPKKKKPWRKKDYRLGADFQRVTRRRTVSNIEGQGDENGRVAEAVTRENVEISAEGVAYATYHGRDCAQAFHVEQRRCDPKRDGAVMAIEPQEDVEMVKVQKSLVPELRGKDVSALRKGKRREESTSNSSSLVNHFDEKKAARRKSKMIRQVGRFTENNLSLSSGEGVEAGLVQSKDFVGQASLSDNSVDLALKVSGASVPSRDGNVHKASDDEGKQKLPQGLPAHDSTSREVPHKYHVKQLSLEKRVTGDTVQSNRVEGRAKTLNGAVEVTQTASQVGGDLTLRFPGTLGGIASREVPPDRKETKRKKDYRLGAEFQRVTRGKAVSSIEVEGDKNGRVAEAVTREQVEISAEGVVSTADNGTHSTLLEATGVEKEALKQGEKFPDVPSLLDKFATASVSVALRNERKESLDLNPEENAFRPAKISEVLADLSQVCHEDKRRSDPKGDDAGMAIQEGEGVEMIEVQKSLVPESRGKGVCALQEWKRREELASNSSSLLNHLQERKAAGGNSNGIAQVCHVIENNRSLSSGDVVEAWLVQSTEFLRQCLLYESVELALKASEVIVPIGDGNMHKDYDNEAQQTLPQGLLADGSTCGDLPLDVNIKDLFLQNGGIGDILQSNRAEERAETLNGPVELTPTASQVGVELTLRSSGGRIASDEVRLRRRTPWRKKDYRLGVDFQRVTRRKIVSNIEGQACKKGKVTETVTREHIEGSAEGVVSAVNNGMDSAPLEETDLRQQDRKQAEKSSDVQRSLDKCATASVSVALRNGPKESFDLNPVEHICIAVKLSEELADSSQLSHLDQTRSDPKGDAAVMAIEEEEEVEVLEVQKSLVPQSRGKEFCDLQEGERREEPTSNSSSLPNHLEDKEAPVATSKVVPAVGHFIENELRSFSSGEGVEAGLVQSKGFVGQASLLDNSVELALEASQVSVPVASGNGQKASDDEGKQKLPQRLPADGSISREIAQEVNVKDLSLQNRGAEGTAQSNRVEGRAKTLNGALEVPENASQAGGDVSLRSAVATGGITSVEVPLKGTKQRRKKDYRLGVDFQRVTRRKIMSSIETKGGENGRVGEEVTRQHVETCSEGAVFTAPNGRDSTPLEEKGVEKEDLKQGEKSSDVSRLFDKYPTASVSVALRAVPKESLDVNPIQNNGMPGKIPEELADSCQTFHMDQRRSVANSDAALMAIEEEEGAGMMEIQNSVLPEARGKDVCALQKGERREEPTSKSSSLVNHLEGKKAAGGKSKMICEVGHFIENDSSLVSGERVEAGLVQSRGFVGQASLVDNSVDSALEVSEVRVPNGNGNVHKASDDEGKQKLPQGLPAHDRTSREGPHNYHVSQLSREKEVIGDTVQSNRVEERAEALNRALEVTQTASKVGGDLTLRFSGALGGIAAREVPPDRKKPKRKKDYRLGTEFQRVTRRRAVSSIEGQDGKNGIMTEATASEHGDRTAEGVVSTADNGRDSTQAYQVDQRRSGSKGDAAAIAVEEEEDVEMMEKSLVRESRGKGVCALQEGERCEEPSSNSSSLLNHLEERKAPVQENLSGQHHGEPVARMESLFSVAQKNDLLSEDTVSPVGPFAVEDGTCLKSRCGQEKASSTIGSGLNPQVSRSRYLEKICAVDLNDFLTAQKADSIGMLDKSESVAMVETFKPVSIIVKSDQVASVVENDPATAVVESDFVTCIVKSRYPTSSVESGPAASRVEMDPAASTVESDTVGFVVEQRPVATEVESCSFSTIVDSDPITTAEGLEPMFTSDNSTAGIPKSLTSERMLEPITAVRKPGCVTAVDKSSCVSIADAAASVATVENSSLPLAVVNAEKCEIDSVRESTARSTEDESSGGESLITEAINSQQQHVALEVPLEDFRLNGDISTKSPLLQPASPAKDSVEPIKGNGDESGIRLENHGMQQGKSTAQTPGGQVAQACLLQHSGVSDGNLGTRNGPDEQTSSEERYQSATPAPKDLRQQLLMAKDDDCTIASDGFTRLQEILEREDLEQTFHCEATGFQEGQPAPVEDSVRQAVSDVDDCLQDASLPSAPSTSRQRRARVEQVPLESSILELTDQKRTVESSDLKGLEQSKSDRTQHEGSRGPLQVIASCSPNSIALTMDRKEIDVDSPISSVEDVLADNDPHKDKLSSRLENLHQPESEGQKPDEPIPKARDEREVIEVNAEVGEVHIEANKIHTEAKHLQSKAEEIVADVDVNAVAKEVNLNVEEASLVMGMPQDVHANVQQIQAAVDEVQVEVLKTQVEVHMVDGADVSQKGDPNSVNLDSKGRRLDTRAKEMSVGAKEVLSQSEVHTEAQEVNFELEMHAKVKDPVADEVRKTDVHDKESVLELDKLETAASSQHLLASNNLVRSCNGSVSDGVLVLSVPEEDISRPLGIPFHSQAQAVDGLTHTDSIPLNTDKDIQLSEQVSLDAVQLCQLTSPVEAGRCLEGDVLQPEELSDIPMAVNEKDDPKNQPISSEDPVSQRNAVKGSFGSRKRKGRFGSERLKDMVGHEGGDRVSSQKKGFLLASTSIESGGMRIRPRPLDPDQSIPILVEGLDKDFYEYDGGSFYRWVQQQEEAKLKKPALNPGVDGVGEGGGSITVSQLVKRRPIFIPLFRKLPDDPQTNSQIVTRPEHGIVLSSSPRPEAYLRHNKSAARTLGNALGCSYSTVPPVYDMDDEDEEWLQGYNENLEHSGQDHRLSEDTFEEIIELFEREFYRISQINNNPGVLTRNLGDKGGASGHRGKRSDAESSRRHSRTEAKLSKSLELFEGPLSEKGIERRFALQNGSEDCCICNGGENSDSNATFTCQICSVKVHQSCYGVRGTEGNDFGHYSGSPNWCCRKCEAVVGGRALPSISCAICCKSGGAMKPTVDPLKWAHVACALYTNETFFVDTDSMEPVDGLATVEARVKKQPLRCGLCGAKEGSCVRCSTRGCRAPFHISCGLSQGAAFEFRQQKDLVVGVRSICPRHASFVPGAGDPTEVLPAVSTESSDTLEMRHVEHTNMAEKGNGTEGAIMNGAACQGSVPNKTNLNRSENRRYLRKKRTGAQLGVTRSKLDASSRPHKISEKDVHGVSRTSPRSGSMLKESMHGVPQYIDETDPYLHPNAEEKLESEAVSAATSGSSSHLAAAFENVDQTGKVTTIGNEVDPVAGDASMSSQVDKAASDAVSLELPSLETLDTNLATPQIVKAVYSFWQSKRLKAKGPILHELRQLQAARSQGIFNKVVQRSSEVLLPVGHDSLARIPVTRRPRSLGTRDPVASRFSDLRQQLETLRSIAGTVVRREQLKLEDQRLLYECAQQRLLIARAIPKSRRCLWCENTPNLLSCSSCPRAFCFQCFKHKRGYGVKGWIAASKQEKYVCSFCSVSTAQEKSWPELGTNLPTFSEPRGTPVSRVALVPGRLGDWNHGLEVRTKSNSGKQVSFLNETTWKGDPPSNPYGSSSSTLAPGSGKIIYDGQPADGQPACTRFSVPSTTERSRAVNRADHDEVLSSGPNDPNGESRVEAELPHEEGKKVKRRKVKVLKKQPETVLRTTKRIKKLARSPSFVYGSEDETTLSESDESRTDKKTVKLSDLRDKGAKSQCTNLSEAGAEGDNKKKGHPPLKCIKFASGKLILRRHGPAQHP